MFFDLKLSINAALFIGEQLLNVFKFLQIFRKIPKFSTQF